jgi:hypothetical protein
MDATTHANRGPLETLYLSQLQRYLAGHRFDAQSETVKTFGLKGGQYGQRLIQEILGADFTSDTRVCRIRRDAKKYYDTDGHISSLGVHIESKYMSFWSAGTAPEKLLYWLCKLEEYNRPTILVLGGMHEALADEPSQHIWSAYHTPDVCKSQVAKSCVDIVRHKLLDVVKLSELRDWAKARQPAR